MSTLRATSRKRTPRAVAWAAMPLVAVCLAQDAPAPSDRNAPYALPFGLSCKKCLGYEPSKGCLAVAQVPIMAVVSGAHEAEALRDCQTLKDPHLGRVRYCSVAAAFRFDHIEFLRNDVQAKPSDRYFSTYDANDVVPDKKEGVFLRADTRYLIQAGPVNPGARPQAEWFIARACELSDESVR
jgi:hypothetical protein